MLIPVLSFLAILCGEGGEKVELFAGTYRTALGLSRTFILPDSPRNLELQLQGDDLVEVFLVFSHNVFGLEPATVRVREVRIGRAERRAARRRAREARTGEPEQADGDSPALGEEDTNVSVSIGVALPTPETPAANGAETPTSARPNPVRRVTDSGDVPSSPAEPSAPMTTVTNPDNLVALAASQVGPYTTFQQLSFAPKFPLATLADECIIPPTYPSVLKYPTEPDSDGDGANGDAHEPQVSPPPGLPLPPSLPPSKWYYKDPKGIVQGQTTVPVGERDVLKVLYRSVESVFNAVMVQGWVSSTGPACAPRHRVRVHPTQGFTSSKCGP
jgi:hypothetical protein